MNDELKHLKINEHLIEIKIISWIQLEVVQSNNTYLPVFVMIISVPRSWNLSHRSFVSKWHSTFKSSSQLHKIFWAFGEEAFSTTISGESRSRSVGSGEPQSDIMSGLCLKCLGLLRDSSLSEHSSTSTSTSSSSSASSMSGELRRDNWPGNRNNDYMTKGNLLCSFANRFPLTKQFLRGKPTFMSNQNSIKI